MPEKDQHQTDGEFHRESYAHGDGEPEEDNSSADQEDRERMAYAPKDADQRGLHDGALAANDGGDGDDVIGIGGMAHAEDKTDRENG